MSFCTPEAFGEISSRQFPGTRTKLFEVHKYNKHNKMMTTTKILAWSTCTRIIQYVCAGKSSTRAKAGAGRQTGLWLAIAPGLTRDNYIIHVCMCMYIRLCIYIQIHVKVIKATWRWRLLHCRHFKLRDANGGDCAIRIGNAGGRIICPKRIRLMCVRYNIYYSVCPATRHMCGGTLPVSPHFCASRLIAEELGFPVFWKIA